MPAYACTPSRGKIALLIAGVFSIFATSFVSFDLNVSRIPVIHLDKAMVYNILHVPLFIFITILWLQIIEVYRLKQWQRVLSAFCFSLLVGLLYEVVQVLNPGRSVSVTDIFVNSFASLAGIVFYTIIRRSSPRLLRKIVCKD